MAEKNLDDRVEALAIDVRIVPTDPGVLDVVVEFADLGLEQRGDVMHGELTHTEARFLAAELTAAADRAEQAGAGAVLAVLGRSAANRRVRFLRQPGGA
jgi:hypothetical protein